MFKLSLYYNKKLSGELFIEVKYQEKRQTLIEKHDSFNN
jgi:hypothetical protein